MSLDKLLKFHFGTSFFKSSFKRFSIVFCKTFFDRCRNCCNCYKTVKNRSLVRSCVAFELRKSTLFIMLDNFEIPLLSEAVKIVKKRFETEASGGVTLQSVRYIAMTGVDFISSGALTHSAGSLDLSLKLV